MTLQHLAIVDDDPIFRDMMADVLEAAGYATYGGPWHADFAALIRSRPPALVVLDIHAASAPDWQFVRHLGSDPASDALPVLICCEDAKLTQRAMLALLSHGGLVHASSFEPDEVALKIKQLLSVTAARTHVASLMRSVGER